MIDSKKLSQDAFIGHFPNQVDAAFCRHLIDSFEKHDHAQHPGHVGVDSERKISPVKQTTDSYILGSEAELRPYAEQIGRAFHSCLNDYIDTLGEAFLSAYGHPFRDTGYKMGKYRQGTGHYAYHVDTWGILQNRFMAGLLYLNDVHDGGGTHFKYLDRRIQPRAGDVVIFPPYFPWFHCGEAPHDGNKYIVNTFFIFDPVQKSLSQQGLYRVESTAAYFEQLPQHLAALSPTLTLLDCCYQFHVTGGSASSWSLFFEAGEGRVETESKRPPDCVITIAEADFVRLANGELKLEEIYWQGRIQFTGSMGLLLRLSELFR